MTQLSACGSRPTTKINACNTQTPPDSPFVHRKMVPAPSITSQDLYISNIGSTFQSQGCHIHYPNWICASCTCFIYMPKHSNYPCMAYSQTLKRGQCRHIFHTWSVWDIGHVTFFFFYKEPDRRVRRAQRPEPAGARWLCFSAPEKWTDP